jgi:UDP-N-acetylmuramoyl-tripeptide--D-alanyl-D-alanine ligase
VFFLAFSWILDLGEAVFRIIRRKYVRPDKTSKALLIIMISFILAFGIWYLIALNWTNYTFDFFNRNITGNGYILAILNIEILLMPFLVSLVVGLFFPVTQFMKNRLISKARTKMAQFKDLKVIGITGSYGKSSTKEFLTKILEEKFSVLATPGNTNTDVGVAGIVLNNLKPAHEIFIVEMGAYKIWEIKKICDLVHPQVGIVTAVKDSHLSLFGSLENIKKAKFELIESLPDMATGIFNLDNEGSADLAERATSRKIKIVGYSTQAGEKHLTADQIEIDPEEVRFMVEGVKFKAQVYGKQNIPNLLAAIAAAREMGMTLEEIAFGVEKIRIVRKTMNLKKASDNLWIVDDTYNANPDGVTAALDYLSIFKDRVKVMVFPGMLELGEKSDDEHRRVARKITKVCDLAIFTSKDFEKPLLEGLGKDYAHHFSFIVDNQQAVYERIMEEVEARPAVVLFISRGSDEVIKKLLNQKF